MKQDSSKFMSLISSLRLRGGLMLLILISLSSCFLPEPVHYNKSTMNTPMVANPIPALRARKPNIPTQKYNGPLKLTIDPSLLNPDKKTYRAFKITSFRTQSLPSALEIWHSDVLTRTTGQPNQFDMTFPANAGKYLLEIRNGDANGNNRLSSATVTVNGVDVAIPDNFNQQVGLITEKLTLPAQSLHTIHVRLQSKPGSFLQLFLFIDPDEVVFYPADPSSLGDLYPDVPGNKNIPLPETVEAAISLNGHSAEPITTGQIAIQVQEPLETNLQALLTEYHAQALSGPTNGWYVIQADMTQVDVIFL